MSNEDSENLHNPWFRRNPGKTIWINNDDTFGFKKIINYRKRPSFLPSIIVSEEKSGVNTTEEPKIFTIPLINYDVKFDMKYFNPQLNNRDYVGWKQEWKSYTDNMQWNIMTKSLTEATHQGLILGSVLGCLYGPIHAGMEAYNESNKENAARYV